MQQLVDTKSLLAKLMATENLIVEQRKVETACFDVKNRVLVIPQLDKNISGYLFDLFVGHEVGHALYTPVDGLQKARDMAIPASIVNLVEDSRIERKIKNKYPGIRTSFVKGYKELIEKDFFGTNGVDLNTLPFLDRLNMFEKGGAAQGIDFSQEERNYISLVQNTETFEDVIEVSKTLASYVKKEKEMMKQKAKDAGLEEEDKELESELDDDYSDFDLSGYDDADNDFEESEDEDVHGSNNSGESQPEGGEEENDEKSKSGSEDNSDDLEEELTFSDTENGDEIRSLTEEAYKKNQHKLFDVENREYVYTNIPTNMELDKIIHNYKKIYSQYKKEKAYHYNEYLEHLPSSIDKTQFNKFKTEANKVVSYLAKEFEMRKNAEQLKRASVAKTGELNMNKIYSYGFSDDIFKKITVLPGGKSHGLVMFVDWSGSMRDHLTNTIKQLLSLVLFCKKVNIPYEVYAFTAEYDTHRITPKEGDLEVRHFSLLNLLSSKMTSAEFTEAAAILMTLGDRYAFRGTVFQMSNTPLNEAVIAAMEIIPQFQKQYKLQIVNTVFLTDGEGHCLTNSYRQREHGLIATLNERGNRYAQTSEVHLVVRDPKTKNQVTITELWNTTQNTSRYIELLKMRTGCNVIGFYVLSGREFSRAAYKLLPRAANVDELRIKFRKEKSMVITNAGFDEYYLLRSEGLDTEEDATFEVKENATVRGLVSAFSKYSKNRLSSRIILNRFIGLVS